jgi:hypothetical protein
MLPESSCTHKYYKLINMFLRKALYQLHFITSIGLVVNLTICFKLISETRLYLLKLSAQPFSFILQHRSGDTKTQQILKFVDNMHRLSTQDTWLKELSDGINMSGLKWYQPMCILQGFPVASEQFLFYFMRTPSLKRRWREICFTQVFYGSTVYGAPDFEAKGISTFIGEVIRIY